MKEEWDIAFKKKGSMLITPMKLNIPQIAWTIYQQKDLSCSGSWGLWTKISYVRSYDAYLDAKSVCTHAEDEIYMCMYSTKGGYPL